MWSYSKSQLPALYLASVWHSFNEHHLLVTSISRTLYWRLLRAKTTNFARIFCHLVTVSENEWMASRLDPTCQNLARSEPLFYSFPQLRSSWIVYSQCSSEQPARKNYNANWIIYVNGIRLTVSIVTYSLSRLLVRLPLAEDNGAQTSLYLLNSKAY